MSKKYKTLKPIYPVESESESDGKEVWCICRSTDGSRFMIACDNCEDWFHGDCVNITPVVAESILKYFCPKCQGKNPTLKVEYKPGFKKMMKEKKLAEKSITNVKPKVEEKQMRQYTFDREPNSSGCGECFRCNRKENCYVCNNCRFQTGQCEKRICQEIYKIEKSNQVMSSSNQRHIQQQSKKKLLNNLPSIFNPEKMQQKIGPKKPPSLLNPKMHSNSVTSSSSENLPHLLKRFRERGSSVSSIESDIPSRHILSSSNNTVAATGITPTNNSSSGSGSNNNSNKAVSRPPLKKAKYQQPVLSSNIAKKPVSTSADHSAKSSQSARSYVESESEIDEEMNDVKKKTLNIVRNDVKMSEINEQSSELEEEEEFKSELVTKQTNFNNNSNNINNYDNVNIATSNNNNNISNSVRDNRVISTYGSDGMSSEDEGDETDKTDESEDDSGDEFLPKRSIKPQNKSKLKKSIQQTNNNKVREDDIGSVSSSTVGMKSKRTKNRGRGANVISYVDDSPLSPVDYKPKQCINVECNKWSRIGSRYCSDECGMKIAELRILAYLPSRIKNYNENESIANQMEEIELKELKSEMDTMIHNLKMLERSREDQIRNTSDCRQRYRNLLLADPTSVPKDNNDLPFGATVGDDMNVECVTCGQSLQCAKAIQHMENCFQKIESATMVFADQEEYVLGSVKLFCDYRDNSIQGYCKRLAALCDHFKDPKEDPDTICAFPFDCNINNYCTTPKNKCSRHVNWERISKAVIDMRRYRLLMRMEDLQNECQKLTTNISQRGGVMNLLLNETIDHQPHKPIIPPVRKRLHIERTTDSVWI